ncbi:MAG: glycosyltransferase, partial [Isosphaeraceae bacterium]
MAIRPTVSVWGVPFSPMTRAEAVSAVADLIQSGGPSYFITANTHYVMLANRMPELQPVSDGAAFILADGH